MVFEKVKAILSEQFDVEEDTITMESNIAEDLGADSLDVVDLLMSIEDEFEIEIDVYKRQSQDIRVFYLYERKRVVRFGEQTK